MKFYDEHKQQRDRFEILAFNLDEDVDSIPALDRKLQPIVKKIWGGRSLPFSSLVDATNTTMENFGVAGFPTVVLIDPQGKVVEGGSLKMLKEKLEARQPEDGKALRCGNCGSR